MTSVRSFALRFALSHSTSDRAATPAPRRATTPSWRAAPGWRPSCASRWSGTRTSPRIRRAPAPPRREARRASRLPDLEAKYEQWGVPLAHPYALDEANMLMLGVRQTFPAWGTLDARGRAAAEDAGERAGRGAGAPPGGRRPGAARVREPTTGRPGAAPAPGARRADVAHPRARAAEPAHRARQPAGRPPAGARADPAAHGRGARRTRSSDRAARC